MDATEILEYAAHAAYIYTAIFLVLGTLGLPIPEEVILLVAGYLAGVGVVSLWLIWPYSLAIVVILDNGIYFSARKLGYEFVEKWGRFILISEERLRKLEAYMDKHGSKTIFFSRILLGFRSAGLIMAGVTKMPWKTFFLWDTLSILFFSSIMIGMGYFSHYNLNMFLKDFALAKHIIFFSIIGIIFIWLITRFISHQKTE